MKISNNKVKTTAAIAIIILMASTMLMATTVTAQTNLQDTKAIPLPSGVTPDVSYDTIAHMSFRPHPIGLGQSLLVNLWLQPPIHVSRVHIGYTVTFTKPDGTKQTVGPLTAFQGDTTAYFEYVVDQIGTWKIKFDFSGDYFPAGNYSVTGYYAGQVLNAPLSVYYKPSSDGPYEFVVQKDAVDSWPGSPLPTDYWTRPASVESREWWSILGNYPGTGIVAGIGRGVSLNVWPADTNKYMSNYGFTPYVQGPKSAHIVWKQQGADGGVIGGTMGIASYKTGGGGPSIVFDGRCYQSITKVANTLVNGTYYAAPTNVWQCYDLQTGKVYWENTIVGSQAPTMIMYSEREVDVVPGEEASSESIRTDLMYVGGGRLITYNPWTGAANWNISIAPLTTGTYYASYDWPYFLSIQTIGSKNYLINWTVAGDPSGFTLGNFRLGIISNITWPFSSLGTVDYEAGIAVNTAGITPTSVGVAYGQIIMGASITTGQLLWNVTTDTSTGLGGFFSGSTAVADHGKFAVRLNDGHWHCWDLQTGKELWVSELTSWPWGTFGCYGVQSYGGNIISNQYDGVAAYNWTNGKVSWLYQDVPDYPYESVYAADATGQESYPWFTGTTRIADGVIYTYNTEHSPSQPITRGLKLHAINATTGEGIWNITGCLAPGAVADGYLTASDSYDGYMYVFGKGQSATTVNAPSLAIQSETSAVISGTVLDQSPAQPGKACVSDDSMATYMEYLHMQHPIDGLSHNITIIGVPVSLDAMDPNGNYVHIASVISDVSGTFACTWTPTIPGDYTITATFAGTNSYGSSWAETHATVTNASAPTSTQTSATTTIPDYTLTIIGMGIAIIIAIIIAVGVATVIIIRKRM